MLPNHFFSLEQVIDRQPLTVPSETPLTEVISMMQEWGNSCNLNGEEEISELEANAPKNNSCVLIVNNSHLDGIFTERDLVKLIATGASTENLTVAEVMTRNVVALTATGEEDIFTALSMLRQYYIRHLPVVDVSHNLLGLITARNLRQKLQPINLMKWRKVSEVMKTEVIDASPNDSVRYIAGLMANHNISCVAIAKLELDSKTNSSLVRPVGIITERDIVQFQNLNLDLDQPARNVMSTPLFLVSPDDTLWSVHQKMQQHRVRRLLVGGTGGELQGIITQTSLLQIFDSTEMYGVIEELQRQVCQLEIERTQLLENRQAELETEVRERTAAYEAANQQLQLEANLRQESEQRFDSILSSLKDVVYSVEPNTFKLLYMNSATENIYGRQIAEFYDNSNLWLEVVHPEDCDSVSNFAQNVIETGASEIEYRILRPDGEIRWLYDRAHLIHNAEGKPIRLDGIVTDITERKQREEVLQRQALIFESVYDGVILTDKEGRIIDWNPSAERMFGYTKSEVLGQTLGILHKPEESAILTPQIIESMLDKGRWSGEIDFIRKDGTEGVCETIVVPLFDQQNKLVSTIGINRDITDRKRREEILKDIASGMSVEMGENFLPSLVQYLSKALKVDYAFIGELVQPEADSIKTLVLYGKGQIINNFEYPLTGTPCANVVGKELCIYPSAVQQLFPDDRLLEEMGAESYAGMPIVDSTGEAFGLISFIDCKPFEDISLIEEVLKIFASRATVELERQQAEAKVRQQAALLDVATDAIMVRGLDNQLLFWNQGAERLYGYSQVEALEQNANELLYRESLTRLTEIQQAVTEQGEWLGELNQVTKAGKKILVKSHWTLVKDKAGNPESYLVVNTDITEQKQLETQFLRTQRLESLGTLATGIAHDLNNILAPILGFAKLLPLKLPNIDEQTLGFFQIMETNAQRGTALVKQILTFAQGLDGARGIIQIGHIIAEIRQVITETFPKNIELEIDVAQNLWTIDGDATQIHQVLMNLVVNARDGMSHGGKLRITAKNFIIDANFARLHLDAHEGNYVLITVTDTGVGIPPVILDRIFEPFFTTKEVGRGTGLGLSTAIGIIRSHGGFIDVYSEIEKGTQFNVFLPASETAEALPPEETAPPQGNGELILVVDDEPQICEVTKAILETFNYQVLTAKNGIDAIAVYAQNQQDISVVIIDIMMPSMNGKTAIRTLKQINPEVKIIAVSGLTSNRELLAEIGDKITTFIVKPYSNDDLLRTVSELTLRPLNN